MESCKRENTESAISSCNWTTSNGGGTVWEQEAMGWGQKWGGQLGMGAKMGEGEAVCGFRNSCRNRNRNKTDVGVAGKRWEAPKKFYCFRNSRRKRNRNCGRNKKSWRDGNKTEVSFGGLGSSMEGLGGKKGSSRKTVVWETVRICFALLSPLKKDLTLTYHIFQGDVVVVVEAQYSERTTHCQRWQSQWSLVTGAGPPQ